MAWSENTMVKLRNWVGLSTYYKHHPLDDDRFYSFIAAIWNEKQCLWDEQSASDIMENEAKKLHPEDNDALIEKVVSERRSEGTLILEFLSKQINNLQ